ncbi:1-(5-phosphoribosyl)-5-[(5-phosphoribosylamino)methylideneamino] imidazole-4-carboxamide isomerase [Elongatibacter sediminis]|uniref:1-(5-phosphoribosyl)-5-[(5-phosphoribosylamino)methylideneamino] imidazole-4-carboxamide isomerase n=1 Tax=Elongatibacter sediminis TaxID=3119006 RepID=A0AAW9RGY8_9GAMM
MYLIPSIDLLDGDVVRLRHGDFADVSRYDVDAAKLAAAYAEAGAEWLHVVDLAASRDGEGADTGPLLKLLAAAPQSVQTGGGVRTDEDIALRLEHGADRVVVGTVCVTRPDVFTGWLQQFGPDHLVAALDIALDENHVPWPRTHGWTETGSVTLWHLMDRLCAEGLRHVLCTDIGKDGALHGPNLDLYRQLVRRYPDVQVQASGGVSGLRDLQELVGTGAAAAISGKALLENCFSIEEALEAIR